MNDPTPHLNAEQIDALLSGAMSAEEQAAAVAHLAACEPCDAALGAARHVDDHTRRTLLGMRPSAGFEDRLILAVRRSARRPVPTRLLLFRAASAAAAVLVVGTVGYLGQHALTRGRAVSAVACASNLRQMGQAILLYSDANNGASAAPAVSAMAVATDAQAKEGTSTPPQQLAGRTGSGFREEFNRQLTRELNAPSNQAASPAPAFRPGDLTKDGPAAPAMGGSAKAATDEALRSRSLSGLQMDQSVAASASAVAAQPLAAMPIVAEPTPPVPPGSSPDAPPQPPATSPATAKIIRNGTMEYEVDRFDSAVATLTKIVQQAGGFVATTNSDTLPNGKVKGLVVLRVPPDRLDTLVLSLRALGDLKSQQITADDVTKQYTDLQAELSADHAMQDRLLELIKSGNGQIKDLLSVEKELAVWKGKIEHAEGELRYYDNLVAMSTLSITLEERDIHTPATVQETETADLGIETEDVEHNYAEALGAVKAAGGRVLESELKRYDAGQLAARVVADVPNESAGAVIDRLKQLGRVARLQVNVKQSSTGATDDAAGPLPSTAPATQMQPARVIISLYNLANVAPRRTTSITVATPDVEAAVAALLQRAGDFGGRVVSSQINRDDPSRATANVQLEVAPDKLAAATATLRADGDVLKLATADSSDTQNTTESKQGIVLQLVALASVNPRETVQQSIAAADVPAAYHRILDAATAAGATIRTAQLDASDPQNVGGTLDFDVLRSKSAAVDAALATAGETTSRQSTRAEASENTVDSKLGLHLTLSQANRLPPRRSITLQLQTADPSQAAAAAQADALTAGGQITAASTTKDAAGQETAKLQLDVPANQADSLLARLEADNTVVAIDASTDPRALTGPLARAHFDLTLTPRSTLVDNNTGLGSTVRAGLSTSIAGLLWSLQVLVVGLCLVLPWVAVIWIGWRVWRRWASRRT